MFFLQIIATTSISPVFSPLRRAVRDRVKKGRQLVWLTTSAISYNRRLLRSHSHQPPLPSLSRRRTHARTAECAPVCTVSYNTCLLTRRPGIFHVVFEPPYAICKCHFYQFAVSRIPNSFLTHHALSSYCQNYLP